MIIRLFFVFLLFFTSKNNISYSLVGVDGVKQGNLPISNTVEKPKINNEKKNINNDLKKDKNISKNNKQKQKNNGIIQGNKPSNVPDFPQDSVEDYKSLFDDGFSNSVVDSFQEGEEFDIFVNQSYSNKINKNYLLGNDEDIEQIEVIEAEKKTVIDNININKDNIKTHRTRIMAYLTLEQMLFADLFGEAPHGYYINAMSKR